VPLFEDTKSELCLVEEISRDDRKTRMLVERELLSLDLLAHPLDFITGGNGFTLMKDLPQVPTGNVVLLAGSVIRYQTPPTRNGNRVVYVIMEDGTGVADVTVFSDVQERCGQVLFREGWLKVKGRIQRRGIKATSIIAEDLLPLALKQSLAVSTLSRG
jgi:error-prone DNA polymerase